MAVEVEIKESSDVKYALVPHQKDKQRYIVDEKSIYKDVYFYDSDDTYSGYANKMNIPKGLFYDSPLYRPVKTEEALFRGWILTHNIQPIVCRNSAYVQIEIMCLPDNNQEDVLRRVIGYMSLDKFCEYLRDIAEENSGEERLRYFGLKKAGSAISLQMIKKVKGKTKK